MIQPMLLGPVYHVEVVTASRQRRLYLLRLIYGLVILLTLWVIEESGPIFSASGPVSSIGRSAVLANSFFQSFSWLQVGMLLLAGPALAVGTIAAERERRTIEYLFATDLSNLEIVLGKTFARLTVLGQLLLVGLPVLFLFRLMGGIPAGALAASFLCAASTAILLTAISTCVSVWSAKVRDATMRVYLLLIVLLLAPVLIEAFFQLRILSPTPWRGFVEPIQYFFFQLNPLVMLGKTLGPSSATGLLLDVRSLLKAVGWQLAFSVFCLAWAAFAVRRVHLAESGRSAKAVKRRVNIRLPRFRLPLGNHPVIWKESFSSTSASRLGVVGWAMVAILVGFSLLATLWIFVVSVTNESYSTRNDFMEYLNGINGFAGSVMLLLLASRAAGLFTSEKERDCWVSLLATPLTGEEIVGGKLLGNLYSGRWIYFLLLFAWMLGFLIDPGYFLASLASLVTMLILACYATLLGLTYSLNSPSTLRSMGFTLGTLVFLGGGYLFCCCVALNLAGDDFTIALAPCIPVLLVFPAAAYVESMQSNSWSMIDHLVVPYVLGVSGYTVAAAMLYYGMVNRFDELAGRTHVSFTDPIQSRKA